jgi:hypothetical protein
LSTFAQAIVNQEARTLNGMKARAESGSKAVDLFYKIGASRGKDIIPDFVASYLENREHALRIAQWARDVRGGAGERKLFRDIVRWLVLTGRVQDAIILLSKVPEIGRWDDMLDVLQAGHDFDYVLERYGAALRFGDRLAAKWAPRKGPIAHKLAKSMGLTPKQYRKLLVEATQVVETQMSAKDWDNINFSHVPSQAGKIYRKAFGRHTPKYAEYLAALKSDSPEVKVNAETLYPYQIVHTIAPWANRYVRNVTADDITLAEAQWKALPSYVGDAPVFAMIDTSGSMTGTIPQSTVRFLDVAVSLGMYVADKNSGPFKDCFLTFSTHPTIQKIKDGNLYEKLVQIESTHWEGSTDVIAAMQLMLTTAVRANVPDTEMPRTLLILSDMQFNACYNWDDSAMQALERNYRDCGYTMPSVVWWNLNSYGNVPVQHNKVGAAMVSGFSPAIMKSILSGEDFTPYGVMLNTIMVPRYDI